MLNYAIRYMNITRLEAWIYVRKELSTIPSILHFPLRKYIALFVVRNYLWTQCDRHLYTHILHTCMYLYIYVVSTNDLYISLLQGCLFLTGEKE